MTMAPLYKDGCDRLVTLPICRIDCEKWSHVLECAAAHPMLLSPPFISNKCTQSRDYQFDFCRELVCGGHWSLSSVVDLSSAFESFAAPSTRLIVLAITRPFVPHGSQSKTSKSILRYDSLNASFGSIVLAVDSGLSASGACCVCWCTYKWWRLCVCEVVVQLTFKYMSESDDGEALELFQDIKNKAEQPESDSPAVEREGHHKRLRKPHKDKKKKKRRHLDYSEEEEDEEEDRRGVRAYIEEEASEDSDEESEINSSAEFMDDEERKRYEEFYMVKKKRETDRFMERVEGKDEGQINRLYQQKAFKRRENETMLPSGSDDRMFILGCKMGKEEELVQSILNKSAYFAQTKKAAYRMTITSALALKKKYPGRIFVEAPSQQAVKESLQGFIDVNTKKVTAMDNEFYSSLFEAKETKDVQFKESQYVRVKKGVYEGDLGKISKIKKNNCSVVLVPRINVQDILLKMREEASKPNDDKSLVSRKDEILRRYTNPRMYYPPHLRPPKKMLLPDVFKDFSDLPSNRRFDLTPNGLIQLSFRYDELGKPEGTMLPIEMQPFSKNGNLVEDFQDEEERKNVISTIRLEKGEEAEIVAGQLAGCYGTVVEVRETTVAIKCKNKEMAGKVVEEHIDHLCKRFKDGQRVKVISGTERGKTGLILRVDGPFAEIWTDNENSIRISKNNLEVYQGVAISTENLLGLRKDDLIKTTKGGVGIVISTNKDNIKMLDTSNAIQIVGNLDYESKINTRNLSAKNKNGDHIENSTIIRIRKGVHEGCRCEVKHVFRDFVFLFSPEFDKTGGVAVERVDNCVVVASNIKNPSRNFKFNAKPAGAFGGSEEEELKVGKSITIGSGPFKGYRGVIKSINKDRIEVRIAQKNCTEWIHRDTITQPDNNADHGRTPRRGLSMTTMYAQSPMNF